MSAELLALAERCEAATGADWELNADIASALGWHQLGKEHGAFAGSWVHPEAWADLQDDPLVRDLSEDLPPAYTVSLDAAMTLVPERCDCRYFIDDPSGTSWKLCEFTGGRITILGEGVTGGYPALALTAAALRARASTQNGGAA